MEESILNWLEVGDSVQKLDVYNNKFKTTAFKIFYNISKHMYFSPFLHYFLIIVFFLQIFVLNISGTNIEKDKLLDIFKYLEKVLLFEKSIDNEKQYKLIIIITIIFFLTTFIYEIIIFSLLIAGITLNYFIKLLSFYQLLYIYYLTGPMVQILIYPLVASKGSFTSDNYSLLIAYILCLIIAVIIIINVILISFYMTDINNINGMDYKSKINDRYMTIIINIKVIYFILEQILALIFPENKYFIIYQSICIFHLFYIIF